MRFIDDARGQTLDGYPVRVLTAVVTALLGFAVVETTIEKFTHIDASSIETACLGVWGCGSGRLLAVAMGVGVFVVLIGTIAYGVRGGFPRP